METENAPEWRSKRTAFLRRHKAIKATQYSYNRLKEFAKDLEEFRSIGGETRVDSDGKIQNKVPPPPQHPGREALKELAEEDCRRLKAIKATQQSYNRLKEFAKDLEEFRSIGGEIRVDSDGKIQIKVPPPPQYPGRKALEELAEEDRRRPWRESLEVRGNASLAREDVPVPAGLCHCTCTPDTGRCGSQAGQCHQHPDGNIIDPTPSNV